ncbi:MAG: SCO family protein [Lentimicrobium sp.]
MKKLILSVILFTTILVSCNKNPEVKTKSCCSTEKSTNAVKDLSGESVYQLTSSWTSQNNENLQLSHFRDKIVIAALVFTHCESACPRIVADMQRIESSFSEKELEQISFLLVSMDPERDTPARLTEFAAVHKLNSTWTLICSSPDATMEIANVLGVKVKKLENGGFDHSNIIHIFDQEGVVVNQQNGFAVEQEETIGAVRAMFQ